MVMVLHPTISMSMVNLADKAPFSFLGNLLNKTFIPYIERLQPKFQCGNTPI